MPRPNLILGIDLCEHGASAVAMSHLQGETLEGRQASVCLLGAAPGWPTLVQAQSEDGKPYRLDLRDPGPIERDEPATPLPPRNASGIAPQQVEQHYSQHAVGVQFLIDQIAARSPDRVGTVVCDGLDPEASDTLLRALRTPRGRVELFPWPIAAAWAWLTEHAHGLSNPVTDL